MALPRHAAVDGGGPAPSTAGEPLRCAGCGSRGPFAPTLGLLLRCPACDLVFADPHLGYEEVARLYGAEYFNGQEYADYLGDKAPIQRSFRRKIAFMRRVAPRTRRVFEVGAAYGFFLELARRYWEVAGIDVAADAVGYARSRLGVDARHGDLLAADVPAGYYDAFCLWDTIEHLARPDAFLARIGELVAPGGFLFISTGDVDSRVARWQGRSWRLIHPPTHLFYFSRATLARLLERHGFRVRVVTSMGMHRSLRQTAYSLLVQQHPRWRPLYDRLAASPLGRMSYYLDLGDLMVVAAQRAAD